MNDANQERENIAAPKRTRKAPRANIAARNYGLHGGDDLGIALNVALRDAWLNWRSDYAYACQFPNPMTARWVTESRYRLRLLCRLRKVARLGL